MSLPRKTEPAAEEVQKCLCQLIGVNTFLSNPDVPGGEKLVVCEVDEKWISKRRIWIAAAELDVDAQSATLLAPQSVFCAKGFNVPTAPCW